MGREQKGRENAWERYQRIRREAGHATGDWSAYCSVPDYCTTSCSDCGREALRARQAEEAR